MNKRFLSVMLLLVASKISSCDVQTTKTNRHKRQITGALPQLHEDIRKAHEEKVTSELALISKDKHESYNEGVELLSQEIELITEQEIGANQKELCTVIITPETDDISDSISAAKQEFIVNKENQIYLQIASAEQPQETHDGIEMQVIKESWKDKITKSKEPNLPSHDPESFKEFKTKLATNLNGIELKAAEMSAAKEEKREYKENILNLISEIVKAKQLSEKEELVERLSTVYGRTSNTKLAHLMIQLSKDPSILSDEQLEKKILLDCAEKLKTLAISQNDSYSTSHIDHGNFIDFHLPLPIGKTEELNELKKRLAMIERIRESVKTFQDQSSESLKLNQSEYLKRQKEIEVISNQIALLQEAREKKDFDSRSHRIASIIASSSSQDFESENQIIASKIVELKKTILEKTLAIEKESLPSSSSKTSWFGW